MDIRYGLGWSVNFGHPQGELVLMFLIGMVLLPPLVLALLGVLFPGSSTLMDATRPDTTDS
jgi:hypothetical protein